MSYIFIIHTHMKKLVDQPLILLKLMELLCVCVYQCLIKGNKILRKQSMLVNLHVYFVVDACL